MHALDPEQERFRLVFEHAPIGMALVSPEGQFTRVNQAMCEITGYSEDELLRLTLDEITHPDDVVAEAERVDRLLTGVIDEFRAEKRYLCPDGDLVVAMESRSLLRDEAGQPEQLVITDRKRMEQELARSNADLADFAYLAAHDLKSPLQAISGFANLLDRTHRGQLDQRGRECVGWILDGAARMDALIEDLLALCRVTTDEPMMVEVDLARVLADVLTETLDRSDATVTAGALPTVMGDPVLFRELLSNLVANAVKFVAPDVVPEVHVSAERMRHGWRLTVADNGIGIEPGHRKRVFGIFNRLHSRDRYPGSGIGLALCQRIVERRGGSIWVEGNAGIGSRFSFTVPDGAQVVGS